MALTLGKPYLVLRTGTKDGKQAVLVMDGDCDAGITLGKPRLSLRTGTKDGKQVQLVADQQLDPDGKLILNKPYLALRSGMKDGKVVVVVPGKQCDEPVDPTVCDVTMCCELDASVRIKLTADPTWTDWENLTLTCGGEIEYHDGHACCEIEVEDNCFNLKVTHTVSEKDTLSSPEAYDDGVNSGTRSAKTVIWTSGNFTISGTTYRLSYYVSETHIFQTAPTVVTTDECWEGYMLQELVTSGSQWDIYGDYWNLIAGETIVGGVPYGWAYNYDNDNPYGDDSTSCPEGYNYAAGELIPEGCSFAPAACAEIDITDPCNEDEPLVLFDMFLDDPIGDEF